MSIVNLTTATDTISTGIIRAGTCTQATASITTTSSIALAANANRKRAMLLNPPTATSTVFLNFTATATVAAGVPLAPGQGWLDEGNPVYTGVFSAIVALGTGSLLTYEWA